MDWLYHGCILKNTDWTNKIIDAGENYLVPTGKCFWKDPSDVKHKVKTRFQTKNEPTVDYKAFDGYHFKREYIDQWVLGKEIWKQNHLFFYVMWNIRFCFYC